MTTLSSLKKQIEALQKKADAIRKTEMAEAIKKIKQLIGQYGLTAQDVGLEGKASRVNAKGRAKAASPTKPAGIAKYSDPQSGKTWTGHGKPPNWIAGVVDRSKFLIEGQASDQVVPIAGNAKPARSGKAAAKASKSTAKKAAPGKSNGAPTKSASKGSSRGGRSDDKSAASASKASKRAVKKTVASKVQEQPAETTASTQAA